MAALDRTSGYFISQLSQLRDPIRSHLWRLNFNVSAIKANFVSGTSILNDISDTDIISLMVREVTVPKITVNKEKSYFMGQYYQYSTNTEYSESTTFKIEERQNVPGYRFLMTWLQHVHNTDALHHTKLTEEGSNRVIDPESDTAIGLGTSKYPSSFNSGISLTRNTDWVTLDQYDYTTGEIIFRVSFINFWPSEIGEVSLNYQGGEFVNYQVVATHDMYRFIVPKGNSTITSE